jgi:hypothetical protein
MEPFLIDNNLISDLRKYKAITPNAIANDLSKYNLIVSADCEMAIVRLRRAMDVMLRNISIMYDIIPGTKPIEQLLTEINKANVMPNIIQKHCKVIKEFGNLAAHGGDESGSDLELSTLSIQEANMCAESISAIAHWYLISIAPSIKEESSLTTVSGIQVTKEMIDQAVEIDSLNYPPELRGVREICYSWHDKKDRKSVV